MLESRMNQVSDLFSRDFNGKATVTHNGSQPVKETYITDTTTPGFKTIINYGKNVEDDIRALDNKLERNYGLDPRIHELEQNAEAAYLQWKKEQERIREDKAREQTIKDSMERLKNEKEYLRETLRQQEKKNNDIYEVQDYPVSFRNDYVAPNYRNITSEQPNIYKDYKAPTRVPMPQQIQSSSLNFERDSYRDEGVRQVARDYDREQQGYDQTIKSNNDDFNFYQPEAKTIKSPRSTIQHYHDEPVNYKDVDVEKIEAASKHCRACEAKYKLILNMVNPYKAKQKITDETIRKLLIQLKALFMSNKLRDAEELVENTLAEGFRHADIYYMAGEIKKALKLHKEAEAYYLQALTFQVHSPYVYQSLGFTYVNLNNHKRAIPLLKHFTEKIVSDSANFELGKCLVACENYLEATVYFGKAIEINPKVGDYYLHRGDSYEALGFMKMAVDDYRTFKKLTPNYKKIFEKNIRDLEKQRKFEEASIFKAYLAKIDV